MMKVNHKKLKKQVHNCVKKKKKRLKRRKEREREGGGRGVKVKEYMLDPCYILVSLLQNVSRDVT